MKNILLPFLSLFVLLSFGEITVRLVGSYDVDGNFNIGKRTLRPYSLPVKTAQTNIEELLKENSLSRIRYDPILGWTNVPLSISKDGMYVYNWQGIRVADTTKAFNYLHALDTFRIVLIGDSFTHGDEMIYENCWAFLLEERMNAMGRPTEVINLGVSGFGMDQAFWRWEILGKLFNPDLVVFGLQMENVRRNVNVMRPVYTPNANIAFSKPKYILDNDSLKIINRPPVAPEKVVSILTDFEKWEWASAEYFYHPADYHPNFFLKSKFLSFLRENISPDKSLILRHPYGTRSGVYPIGEEPAQVTFKILEKMEKEVNENGGELLMVHLPHIWGLGYLRKYGALPYDELLKKINGEFDMLDTKGVFMKNFENHINDDFYLRFHYSKLGNEIVAETVANYIIEKYVSLKK